MTGVNTHRSERGWWFAPLAHPLPRVPGTWTVVHAGECYYRGWYCPLSWSFYGYGGRS
jgi:hypothetical protein